MNNELKTGLWVGTVVTQEEHMTLLCDASNGLPQGLSCLSSPRLGVFETQMNHNFSALEPFFNTFQHHLALNKHFSVLFSTNCKIVQTQQELIQCPSVFFSTFQCQGAELESRTHVLAIAGSCCSLSVGLVKRHASQKDGQCVASHCWPRQWLQLHT